MYDLTQPIPTSLIIGSIAFIFALVGVGVGLVIYYKKKRQ